jgi:hypothetical protein
MVTQQEQNAGEKSLVAEIVIARGLEFTAINYFVFLLYGAPRQDKGPQDKAGVTDGCLVSTCVSVSAKKAGPCLLSQSTGLLF